MHHHCHQCDYDLLGLADKGHCPECGEPYDKHSSFRAIQAREPAFVKHVKWVSLALFTFMVLVCGGLLSAQATQPWGGLAVTLVIASVSGFGAFTYWWVMRQESRGSD